MKIPLGAALLITFMSRLEFHSSKIAFVNHLLVLSGTFSACNPSGVTQRDRIPVSVESIKG